MSDLLDLIFSAVIWRVVAEWVRDVPVAVQLVVGLGAAAGFVWLRTSGRRRSRRVRS